MFNNLTFVWTLLKTGLFRKGLLYPFLILGGIAFTGYASYTSDQKLLNSQKWVNHTELVIQQSDKIVLWSKDMVIASRGFVLTNDSIFLRPLHDAQKNVFVYIAHLSQLVSDNKSQQQLVDSLGLYVQKRLDFSLNSITLRSKQGVIPAVALISSRDGEVYSDRLDQISDSIQMNEEMLLQKRKDTNEHSIINFNRVSIAIFCIMMLAVLMSLVTTGQYLLQNREKEKRAAELVIANKELVFQNEEKQKRAAELIIANKELAFQNKEKQKRAIELVFQNEEKELRAEELIIANKELVFQNEEKELRAEELVIANKELAFQNEEKELRADELIIANKELAFQNEEKELRADELIIANKELAFQNEEKELRAEELIIANKELAFQNEEKELRAEELVIANNQLIFQNKEKEKLAAQLAIANKELVFQNEEKGKRALELAIAYKDLKDAEDNLRKWNEELEQKVAERTEELLTANKELDSFSYSVSHDLRAPLRAISGYTKILKEKYAAQLDAEANRLMNKVLQNGSKMGQLIDELLSFSRLGRKELVPLKIDMHDMVTDICDELVTEDGHHTIEFNIKNLPAGYGDFSTIKQVWLNLISNAVKYSKLKEKAIIEIGFENTATESIYYIKDNGAGFDMRYAPKLFGVFQRLHSDEEFEGTGVGLAIVHRIITKHGGRVWAESKVNEGAIFYFALNKNAA